MFQSQMLNQFGYCKLFVAFEANHGANNLDRISRTLGVSRDTPISISKMAVWTKVQNCRRDKQYCRPKTKWVLKSKSTAASTVRAEHGMAL